MCSFYRATFTTRYLLCLPWLFYPYAKLTWGSWHILPAYYQENGRMVLVLEDLTLPPSEAINSLVRSADPN